MVTHTHTLTHPEIERECVCVRVKEKKGNNLKAGGLMQLLWRPQDMLAAHSALQTSLQGHQDEIDNLTGDLNNGWLYILEKNSACIYVWMNGRKQLIDQRVK